MTAHFALRLAERNLSLENVKSVVQSATDVRLLRRGQSGGKVSMFKKAVDGKTLAVVAEVKNVDCWIVTAYYET